MDHELRVERNKLNANLHRQSQEAISQSKSAVANQTKSKLLNHSIAQVKNTMKEALNHHQ